MALPDSCNTHPCESQIKNPHQSICPAGWHIPTIAEWNKLISFAGVDVDYPYMLSKKLLKASPLWESPPNGGTDDFGFSALPGGYISGFGGWNSYIHLGIQKGCYFWSTTESEDYSEFGGIHSALYKARNDNSFRDYFYKDFKLSIRCIKD
jgi:uncharacterized protein (TIGR02145 family)